MENKDTLNESLSSSRSWNAEQIIDQLNELKSPLQVFGGIMVKMSEELERELIEDARHLSEQDVLDIKADISYYDVQVKALTKGLNLIYDLVDYIEALPSSKEESSVEDQII